LDENEADTYYGYCFLSGDAMAQTEEVKLKIPESRLMVVAQLVVLACVPVLIIWRRRT
jgi:hypothetical protein